MGRADLVTAGVRALTWLCQRPAGPDGRFAPSAPTGSRPAAVTRRVSISSRSSGDDRGRVSRSRARDQRPVWRSTRDGLRLVPRTEPSRSLALRSLDGGCRDGLHAERANENQGAESTLAFLLALSTCAASIGRSGGHVDRGTGFDTLFHRDPRNPILSADRWPYPAHSVFNPAATKLADGTTLLLCRVEDRRGLSHLCAARSANGLDGWVIDPAPTFLPDPANHPEELWGVEDPRITYVEELGRYAVAYTAFGRGGPGVALALTSDFRTFDRCGLVMQPDDKDAALLPRRDRRPLRAAAPPDRRRRRAHLDVLLTRPPQLGRASPGAQGPRGGCGTPTRSACRRR
jgi:hypothetical protein